MSKVYILDDRVLYKPDQHLLIKANGEGPASDYQLNTPASRCLLLMLENRPDVVSKEMFFEYAWNQHGTHVSTNTFYQNVSLLRKGLRVFDLEDVIKTVSKKGLKIADCIKIEEFEEEDTIVEPVPLFPTTAENSTVNMSAARQTNSLSKSGNVPFPLVAIVFLLLVGLGAFWVYTENHRHHDHFGFFENYILLTNKNECAIYYPHADKNTDAYLSFVASHDLKCPAKGVAYVNVPHGRTSYTMVVCNKSINSQDADCISYNGYRNKDDKE